MSEHPDLLALLRGELRNPVVVEAGDHLDTCAACRSDLAELVTAHSLLSRSARTLGNPAPAPEPAPEHAPALPPVPRPSSRRRAAGVLVAAVAVAVAGTTVVLTRAPDYRVLLRTSSAPRSTRSRVPPAVNRPAAGRRWRPGPPAPPT